MRGAIVSCLHIVILRGRRGRAVPYFRTRCYVQDERYFAIEHRDVRRKASLGLGRDIHKHYANLKEVAPAHPCARDIPFILNITVLK